MSNNQIFERETEDAPEEFYYVVKNHEEQYSIWPSYKPIPKGWQVEGEVQIKAACLDYIEKVWTDMRPLSLRNKMKEIATKEKGKKDE